MEIDLGSITVPTRWEDVTLKQYQDITNFYGGDKKNVDIRDILHILTNKTEDEINEIPMDLLEIILSKLDFMQKEPEKKQPTNMITINGETYQVNVMNKLKTGEYVAADNVIKNDPSNLAAILAIICRKDDEKFDAKFENEVLEDRIKMFENVPVTDVLPVIAFFFDLYMMSVIPTQLYSEVEETLNLTQQNIESSTKIGVFRKCYLNYRLKRLHKSIKSIKNT